MLKITENNTEFFNDIDALMITLYSIDYKIKLVKYRFFYEHQISSNELGYLLTVNIIDKITGEVINGKNS